MAYAGGIRGSGGTVARQIHDEPERVYGPSRVGSHRGHACIVRAGRHTTVGAGAAHTRAMLCWRTQHGLFHLALPDALLL